MTYGDEVLFSRGMLDGWLRDKGQMLAAAISARSMEDLAATDSESLADDYADIFYVEALEINRDDVIAENPVDVQVEVRRRDDIMRPYGAETSRQGTRYQFVIPFTGNADLMLLQPNTRILTEIRLGFDRIAKTLTLTHDAVTPNAKAITRDFNTTLDNIEKYIEWQRPQIEAYNAGIRDRALKAIGARRQKLSTDETVLADLGFAVTTREDAPKILQVPKKRSPIRKAPSPRRSSASSESHSILGDESYEGILDTLDAMALAMEYSPSAFRTMDEEALRTIFMVPLNIHYEMSATAETFNYEGETDIIIKHEGRNLFIAECMIWHGAVSLSQKIDQLLGYASWRDTKTAILIFSRNKSFSKVLEQISPTIREHPSFIREVAIKGDTRFRFRLASRDDADKHLTLTILAFDVPS